MIGQDVRRLGRIRFEVEQFLRRTGNAAVVGAAIVFVARPVLPYALAFAAGAMIFVVVEEVIPESQRGGNTDIATLAAMTGFAVMMTLDVALG